MTALEKLRQHQFDAYSAIMAHMKKSTSPALAECCTSFGKTLLIIALADKLTELSKKKVLILVPNKELVEQGIQSVRAGGSPCSAWSASVGKKCMAHDIVYGTPQSIKNDIKKFCRGQFGAVIVDEAHEFKGAQINIISAIKESNPLLRVVGLTGTPYRLGNGFIFKQWPDGSSTGEDSCKDPYYARLVYRCTTNDLMAKGWLTPVVTEPTSAGDAVGWREGKGRKTSDIIHAVVSSCADRHAVMIFCGSIEHAQEAAESLPVGQYEIVTGETPKKVREITVSNFRAGRFKYLVNVAVFTTGFDVTRVDCIAMLRKTESRSLFQQIIGRGIRLHEGKKDCLLLDYAENISDHGLRDDLFEPDIKTNWKSDATSKISAFCPVCGIENSFSARPNPDQFDIDEEGYFLDLDGQRIGFEGQELPAHFGRRCTGLNLIAGEYTDCTHRWSRKVCGECGHENDIAARKCTGCKGELIDPAEKLKIEHERIKKNPRIATSDRVLDWNVMQYHVNGREGLVKCVRVDWTVEYRTFKAYYFPSSKAGTAQHHKWQLFVDAVGLPWAKTVDDVTVAWARGQTTMPITITAHKVNTAFRITAYNEEEA